MAGRLKRCLGIEIGGTKLLIVTGDQSGRIETSWRAAVERGAGAKRIRGQIERGIRQMSRGGVAAVGVGFGGPINWRTGKIERSYQIEGWSGCELGTWIAKVAGAPAAVDNDANVGALGVAMRGAGMKANPVFYVTLGSGVGGGVVVGGRI